MSGKNVQKRAPTSGKSESHSIGSEIKRGKNGKTSLPQRKRTLIGHGEKLTDHQNIQYQNQR